MKNYLRVMNNLVDQVRVPPTRQHHHRKNRLHRGLEPQERDLLPGRQVDRPDAAGQLLLGQARCR
jgi:hypothetical protein